MRILIFTDAYEPQLNGVVRTLTTTVEKLIEKGHSVKVVSPINFYCIPKKLTKWAYPDIDFSIPSSLKVKRIIKNFKPDAIHISTEGPIGWSAWIVCLMCRIKFTTTYHTKFPEYLKVRFFIPLCIGYAYERLFHNRSYRTMVATQSLKTELKHRGFKRMVFWGRGVDTVLFNPIYRSKAFFNNDLVALYFGRISHEKNIGAFLEAEWYGKKVVVGDGPQLDELKLLYPNVKFVGRKTGVELATHVASATITVFPSLTDTFGLTVLESLSCGTPVVAFNVTGPKDQIEHFKTGFLAPIKSSNYTQPEILSARMQWAIGIDRKRCRDAAEKNTWDKCTDQFIKNLEEDRCNIELYSSRISTLEVVTLRLKRFFRLLKTEVLKRFI